MKAEQQDLRSHSWHSVLKLRDDRVARVSDRGQDRCANERLAIASANAFDQLVRHQVESLASSSNHALYALDHKNVISNRSARDMATNVVVGPVRLDGSEHAADVIPAPVCVIVECGALQ
jgi:hypothetical protein